MAVVVRIAAEEVLFLVEESAEEVLLSEEVRGVAAVGEGFALTDAREGSQCERIQQRLLQLQLFRRLAAVPALVRSLVLQAACARRGHEPLTARKSRQ